MSRTLCVILLLVAGCASARGHPSDWVTRAGSPADAEDYADCLSKARDTAFVASDGGVPVFSLPQTDRTLLAVCMQAHGYRLRPQSDDGSQVDVK